MGLCLAQLPAREDRIHEPMILTQEQTISALVNHMLPYLEEPYVLVGHSFGALLCYDVMVELQRLGLPIPLHAFLSSYAPEMRRDLESLLNLPEEAFIKEIQDQFQGLPQSVLNDKNLQKMLFSAIKADFHYIAKHAPLQEKILRTSITTLCGNAEKITSLDMNAWKNFTRGDYEHHTIPGGHFMIIDQQKAFLEFLMNRIGKIFL
jgi:medium-chain acyl-[acyl-carrier-protein] hydrolase